MFVNHYNICPIEGGLTRRGGWPGLRGAPLEAEDAALAVERARLSYLLDLCTGSRAAVEDPTSRITRADAQLARSTGRAAWLSVTMIASPGR